MLDHTGIQTTPLWGCFEHTLESTLVYDHALHDVHVTVSFTSSAGTLREIDAFWDGGTLWRVRFMPGEIGIWHFETSCSDEDNQGLHKHSGSFECIAAKGTTRFDRHGSIGLSDSRRHFVHADSSPFFWMADTCWNGPLLSTDEEWAYYLAERRGQQFTAVQFVATQWLVSPQGDSNNEQAFDGCEQIRINPTFFQRLDRKIEAANQAGMLAVPVLLWAAEWRDVEVNQANPGYALPEGQAILLARYMVARWGGYHAAWLLPGDGDYRGQKAERWKRIGRAVFGDKSHAPVSLHPFHMQLMLDEFQFEPWLDIVGYQSGHGDDDDTIDWLVCGPPSTEWKRKPARPFINLEPPYENHLGYQSKQPHSDFSVRRALYWSLLNAPTAGVTYGGHGVWGWDDGSHLPAAHEHTGMPLPWREGINMPAAGQIRHLMQLMTSIEWWRLVPDLNLLVDQPGKPGQRNKYVAASRSDTGDLAIIYTPEEKSVYLDLSKMPLMQTAYWFDPRSGKTHHAYGSGPIEMRQYDTPAPGDWILVLDGSVKHP